MSNKTIPTEIIEKFRTLSKSICSWSDIGSFAEAMDDIINRTHEIDPANFAQGLTDQLEDEQYVNLTCACMAIQDASRFLADIRYLYPVSNPELALEKAFKVGDIKWSIVKEQALLEALGANDDMNVDDEFSSQLRALKTEVPEITMKSFLELVPTFKRPLRLDMYKKIKAILEGPSSLN